MVRGLFARAEQDAVLATFEKSVVYVTSDTIESILLNHRWEHSRWDLANMYLLSVGAKLLGKKAARIVGMSEETTCYVSPDYFAEDDDPFADFIVHEAAHIFHNCKRRTLGLRETRTKEWLLDIEFLKRETFAYSCEAYARIVARAKNPTERALAERLEGDLGEVCADDETALGGATCARDDCRPGLCGRHAFEDLIVPHPTGISNLLRGTYSRTAASSTSSLAQIGIYGFGLIVQVGACVAESRLCHQSPVAATRPSVTTVPPIPVARVVSEL